MRIKIISAPEFPLTIPGLHLKIVSDYQNKYNAIDTLLESNKEILDLVHEELSAWGADSGRESTYSSEQFLRLLVVKCIEGLSFRDTIIRVSDSHILRNFVKIFSGKLMNFTVLNTASKLITPQTWEKINLILFNHAKNEELITGDKLRIDSTVCECNIHYPTDASLLWDGYRVIARLMRQCVQLDYRLDIGYRFHDKKIKALYTFIATQGSRKKKATKRSVRKRMRKLLQCVSALHAKGIAFIANAVSIGKSDAYDLLIDLSEILELVDHVVAQSQRAFDGEKVPASERIFSIFEPHTELLKRGKAHKPNEFGHMVSIGQTEEKFISYYNVEEKSRHDIVVGDEAKEDHKKKFGSYPRYFAADKNYYGGAEHTVNWEEEIEVYSVGKKGKRSDEEREREHGMLFRLLQKFRAGCEGSISVLKRVFGLARCLNRGFSSFASSIGCVVFCHNLVVLAT